MKAEKGKDDSAKQELREIMQEWHQAIFEGDKETSARLRADDFISVNPSGEKITKEQELATIGSPDLKFDSLKTEDITVQFIGETAVVMGFTNMKARYRNKEIDGRFRYTNVFIKRDRRWQAAISQATKCDS